MKIILFIFILMGIILIFTTGCKKDKKNISDNNNNNTPVPETVTDIDGNVYHTIKIGTSAWLRENLKVTRYNDGTAIKLVIDNDEWWNLSYYAERMCWYNNDQASNGTEYGALYTYSTTISSKKLCPAGWHVPSDGEWAGLEIYLQNNGYNYDGTVDEDYYRDINNKTAKAMASTTGWDSSSVSGAIGNADYPAYRNKTDFNALPGGVRAESGGFAWKNINGNYWSTTSISTFYSWSRLFRNDSAGIERDLSSNKTGMSVRCIRDL